MGFPILVRRHLYIESGPWIVWTMQDLMSFPRVASYNWYLVRKKNTSTMTSSNGNIFALLALCAGNSPVSGDISTQRPVARSFDVFFDLRLIKRLSKHSRGWWFETLSRPPWRHCNATNGHHGCNFVIFLWWDYSTLTLILHRDAFTCVTLFEYVHYL